jgi:hypothetical protein
MRTARRMSQTAWPWKPIRTATSGASDGAGAFAALAACLAIGSRFRAAWPASFRLSGSPAFRATRRWPGNHFPWRYRSDLQRVAVTAATNWTGLIRRWSALIWSRASLSGSVRDAGILVAGAEDTRRALCPPRRGANFGVSDRRFRFKPAGGFGGNRQAVSVQSGTPLRMGFGPDFGEPPLRDTSYLALVRQSKYSCHYYRF